MRTLKIAVAGIYGALWVFALVQVAIESFRGHPTQLVLWLAAASAFNLNVNLMLKDL